VLVVPEAKGARYSAVGILSYLTKREKQVLDLMLEGLTKAQIGARMGITETTVKTHTFHMYDKLGAKNGTHAVWQALRLGIIQPPNAVGTVIRPSEQIQQPSLPGS
jgi:DNA-binding NarL/FixJ family response regulator